MIGSGSSFFLAWLGTYDFLAHYARGGDPNVFPEPTASAYGPQFEAALVSMLTNNPAWKGVVGTVPDLLASPFFQMVGDPSALVPLDATDDAATIGLLSQLSGGVNIHLQNNKKIYLCEVFLFGIPSIGHSSVPIVGLVISSTILRVPSGSLTHFL